MNFGSLYTRLRITATATQTEIKSAYYRLSKIYHPDKNLSCTNAAIKFRSITEAYEILANPKARAEYDKESSHRKLMKRSPMYQRPATVNQRKNNQHNQTNVEFNDANRDFEERMRFYRKQMQQNAQANNANRVGTQQSHSSDGNV